MTLSFKNLPIIAKIAVPAIRERLTEAIEHELELTEGITGQ